MVYHCRHINFRGGTAVMAAVLRSSLSRPVPRIVECRSQEKMIRVDASRIIAAVADQHVARIGIVM